MEPRFLSPLLLANVGWAFYDELQEKLLTMCPLCRAKCTEDAEGPDVSCKPGSSQSSSPGGQGSSPATVPCAGCSTAQSWGAAGEGRWPGACPAFSCLPQNSRVREMIKGD